MVEAPFYSRFSRDGRSIKKGLDKHGDSGKETMQIKIFNCLPKGPGPAFKDSTLGSC